MITSDEAKELRLQGWDTYKYSNLLYKDNLHQKHGVVVLNHEAYKILKDTICINRHIELKNEGEIRYDELSKMFQDNEQNTLTPTPLLDYYVSNWLLEYVKIALALELHLKSRLLDEGYIVHQINGKTNNHLKQLKNDQLSRPISISEYFEVDQYVYNEEKKINILQGLSNASIEFSVLLKEGYLEKIGLKINEKIIINDIREIRNTIHLPGDIPNIQYKNADQRDILIRFINENIVEKTNNIICHMDFPSKLLLTEF